MSGQKAIEILREKLRIAKENLRILAEEEEELIRQCRIMMGRRQRGLGEPGEREPIHGDGSNDEIRTVKQEIAALELAITAIAAMKF